MKAGEYHPLVHLCSGSFMFWFICVLVHLCSGGS